MKLGALVRDRSLLLPLGIAAVGAVAAVALFSVKKAPPPPPMPGARVWVPVQLGGAVQLAPGAVYRAAVDLPWAVPTALATPERVQAYAAKEGFRDARSWRDRPVDWPAGGPDDPDLFVQATWDGGPRSRELPDAVRAAWVLA